MARAARLVTGLVVLGGAVAAMGLLSTFKPSVSIAQPTRPAEPAADAGAAPLGATAQDRVNALAAVHSGTADAKLLRIPVTKLFPGNVSTAPKIKNPIQGNAEAVARGMRYFVAFNCVGCHAANGGGGMGPSLSNSAFIYGGDPANIYLTIYQGRPRGMPAWGAMLADNIIWDLVAYIGSISKQPSQQWGTTVSATMPKIEQVPAEYQSTPAPWNYTETFSDGQKPNRAK